MAAESFKGRWRGVWRTAQRDIAEQGRWAPAVAPLLDEYVGALAAAEQLRKAAEKQPTHASTRTGRPFVNPAFARWDAECRRALSLARALGLTPAHRKAVKKDEPTPFDTLDELAPRRQHRAAYRIGERDR